MLLSGDVLIIYKCKMITLIPTMFYLEKKCKENAKIQSAIEDLTIIAGMPFSICQSAQLI